MSFLVIIENIFIATPPFINFTNFGLSQKAMHKIMKFESVSSNYSNHHLSKQQLFIQNFRYRNLSMHTEIELNDLLHIYPILHISIESANKLGWEWIKQQNMELFCLK